MTEDQHSLVLRLAGPLQSWGERSQFNRRETSGEPTKGGILGLLAAASGRRRQDPIEDLLNLRVGVRIDQAGTLLRDYHTVSDYRGRQLLSATVGSKGLQKPTSPAKFTHITQRFYLQDAVFVTAINGPPSLLADLRQALRHPAFPLALGRRACVPTQPLVLDPTTVRAPREQSVLWSGDAISVLEQVPWQASKERVRTLSRQRQAPSMIDLPISVDDPQGDDLRSDLPRSFDPQFRSFGSRRVSHGWVRLSTPFSSPATAEEHDPFALLGW